MKSAEGKSVCTVTIEQTPSGVLYFMVDMEGLPPGAHGFHADETGKCDAADGFKSAGGHYAGAMGRRDGVRIESAKGPGPGDLPTVTVGEAGVPRQRSSPTDSRSVRTARRW